MMKHLWHTQRYLCNLQLNFELLSPSADDILGEDSASLGLLQNVDELDVNFAATVDAGLAHELLCFLRLHTLRKVKVTVVPPYPVQASFGDQFFTQHFPATLTHITLNFVILPAPEYLQLDLHPGLVYLNLHDCQNTGPVMEAFKRPILREFSYHYSAFDPPPRELSSMLLRFNNLKKLAVDVAWLSGSYDYDRLTLGITMHRRTLTTLLLWVKRESRVETLRLFLQTATMCTQLRQLALQFDATNIFNYCKVNRKSLDIIVLIAYQIGSL